jgi:hypothetical protein
VTDIRSEFDAPCLADFFWWYCRSCTYRSEEPLYSATCHKSLCSLALQSWLVPAQSSLGTRQRTSRIKARKTSHKYQRCVALLSSLGAVQHRKGHLGLTDRIGRGHIYLLPLVTQRIDPLALWLCEKRHIEIDLFQALLIGGILSTGRDMIDLDSRRWSARGSKRKLA